MHQFLQQIFSGLAAGAIYASLALALVMIYRATELVNFAQGEMAMFSTYIAWTLVNAGLPFWLAFRDHAGRLVRRRHDDRARRHPAGRERAGARRGDRHHRAAADLQFASPGWIYSYTVQDFPSPFPDRPVFGALMTTRDLGVIGVTLVMLVLLFAVLPLHADRTWRCAPPRKIRRRRGSAAFRVGRMLAIGWGLAAAIGATAGIMVAPVLFLDPNMMGGVLLYAFAGALLGGITSPVGAVIGGLIVGVTENLVGTYLIASQLKLTVALALIILVLVFRPNGLFGTAIVRRV